MGTDELGRDIFSRIVWGSRFSLSIGFLAVFFSAVVGMLFGAIAGYFGSVVDDIIMRLMDVVQSIPGILIAITISVVLGPGLFNTLLALSFGGIVMSCRMTRAAVLGVRHQEYLEAATSIGRVLEEQPDIAITGVSDLIVDRNIPALCPGRRGECNLWPVGIDRSEGHLLGSRDLVPMGITYV